jgi:hypothetical protein
MLVTGVKYTGTEFLALLLILGPQWPYGAPHIAVRLARSFPFTGLASAGVLFVVAPAMESPKYVRVKLGLLSLFHRFLRNTAASRRVGDSRRYRMRRDKTQPPRRLSRALNRG